MIHQKIKVIKWHIYGEFILACISVAMLVFTLYGLRANPVLEEIITPQLIIFQMILISAFLAWLGFLAYRVKSIFNELVEKGI